MNRLQGVGNFLLTLPNNMKLRQIDIISQLSAEATE